MSDTLSVTPLCTLESGDWRVTLAPTLGGSITSARWRGQDVLRATAEADLAQGNVRRTACYPLLPFSNRIAHAGFTFEGARHALLANFPGEPHAIHGVGFQRPWQVVRQEAGSITLALEHQPDRAWPFAFLAHQHISVDGDTLTLALEFTNRSAQRAPCGLGWHPFFPLDSARGPTHLHTGWSSMLLNGPDKLPRAAVAPPALGALDDTVIDNCFTGWTREATISAPRHTIHLTASDTLCCAVLFRPEGQAFFAFEPVSHANNALHGQLPAMHVLEPGASLSARVSLTLCATAPTSMPNHP
ncbi:aldose 1-epimerase [Herbaspirillum sp. LeCh32-8]|uniref:aldose 1-epimerase n=1 Tax=Herbaspirillum sp. LeCh32-8 TaxID=2821356 RepID=UPI001AE55DAA|nr:aldose 1-epimerase [Herbaspirillum sp. LeCh32-8]MBP0597833.1 aldose 1-epimerase [Herbaspirillum sp. LeCh32-8]